MGSLESTGLSKKTYCNEQPGRPKVWSTICCFSALTQVVFPGLSLLNCAVGVGGGGLCTGCFGESLSPRMLTGNSSTSFSLCVPVYVRENTGSQIVQGKCMATEFGAGRTIKSLHLTRPRLPGIQNGNNDDLQLQGCSKT